MTYQQVALNLLQGIEHHTYEDEQRGSSEELRELLLDAEDACEGGHDGYQGDEERAGKNDVRHHVVKIVGGGFAGLYARDETVVSLHIFGHLHGVERDGCVEVGECYDQYDEYCVVHDARMVEELCHEPAAAALAKLSFAL